MPLRIVFFGTPAFAVPSLEALAASVHPVVGVVTQPDRPRGRGHKVQPEAVKRAAVTHELPLLQPERLKDEEFQARLKDWDPDLGVVAAYGKILPAAVLALPRLGMINVHASLLPRWRGAAPVHRAILAGDPTTGVTIMRVVQALDAGPMLSREAVEIGISETSAALEHRLALLGAGLLVRTIDRLAQGGVVEEPQDESQATYASRLQRSDGVIDWARPARAIHDQIRGLQPWPLASAWLSDKRVLFLRSELSAGLPGAQPGEIVAVDPDALVVAAGTGAIRLLDIQLEGRPPMPVRAFLNGHRVSPGARFTPEPAPAR